MGDRMGSSPIDRTKKNDLYIHCASLFFCKGARGLERDVKKTARCAVFSPRRDSNRVSGAKKRRTKRLRPQGCGASPIDRTNRKDDIAIVFFHFLPKMMRRCRSVGAHVRCARATQMQALDCPSLAVDRTKKMTCTFIVQVFFFCKGVRDLNGTLRKQHSALFLVPGVIATALAAQKKAYETPAPVGLRSKSHRPHQQKRR